MPNFTTSRPAVRIQAFAFGLRIINYEGSDPETLEPCFAP